MGRVQGWRQGSERRGGARAHAVLFDTGKEAVVYDIDRARKHTEIHAPGDDRFFKLALDSTGERLLTASSLGVATMWDLASNASLWTWSPGNATVLWTKFAGDEHVLVIVDTGAWALLERDTGAVRVPAARVLTEHRLRRQRERVVAASHVVRLCADEDSTVPTNPTDPADSTSPGVAGGFKPVIQRRPPGPSQKPKELTLPQWRRGTRSWRRRERCRGAGPRAPRAVWSVP